MATVGLVAAGLAVALVPKLRHPRTSDDVHVVEVPNAGRTISALTRPSGTARPNVWAVVEHLRIAADALARRQAQSSMSLSMT